MTVHKSNFSVSVTQDPVQPLCQPVNVSESDILEQENKGIFLTNKSPIKISSKVYQNFLVHLAQQALARALKLYEMQQRERQNGVEIMTS